MSQEIKTVLASCGADGGIEHGPPPPGPMMRKSPGRCAHAQRGREQERCRWRFLISWILRQTRLPACALLVAGSPSIAVSFPTLESDPEP